MRTKLQKFTPNKIVMAYSQPLPDFLLIPESLHFPPFELHDSAARESSTLFLLRLVDILSDITTMLCFLS